MNPQYYFTVSVKGQQAGKNRESGMLKFRDTAEFRVVAIAEKALPDKTVTFTFADGFESADTAVSTCPEYLEWESHGLGAAIIKKHYFDLNSIMLYKTEYWKCIPRQ